MSEEPSSINLTTLERVLEGVPDDIRLKLLETIQRHGLHNQEDVLFQVVEILGIYATYFESVPVKFQECIEDKLGRLEIIATHIQKTSGDDYEQLKEEGVALITSLQEFVILTQSVKDETNSALQRTSTHLQELSESFSKEIKDKIIVGMLDDLVEKVKTTLEESEQALKTALTASKQASEEIASNTEQILAASRAQIEDAHAFDVSRIRKRYAIISIFWGAGIAMLFSIAAWTILEFRSNLDVKNKYEAMSKSDDLRWEEYVKDMSGNKEILKSLASRDIILKFIRQGKKNYLVIPKGPSFETEVGTYIEVPVNIDGPKLD